MKKPAEEKPNPNKSQDQELIRKINQSSQSTELKQLLIKIVKRDK